VGTDVSMHLVNHVVCKNAHTPPEGQIVSNAQEDREEKTKCTDVARTAKARTIQARGGTADDKARTRPFKEKNKTL